MKFEMYQWLLTRFPMLSVWLDVPTYPTAEQFLGEYNGREFRRESVRHYLETRVAYVKVQNVSKDLWEIPYCSFRSLAGPNMAGWTEEHQVVWYHFAGEKEFSRAFAPGLCKEGTVLRTLSDVARAIREVYLSQEVVVDGLLTHRFEYSTRFIPGTKLQRGLVRSLSIGVFTSSTVLAQ